MIDGVNSMYILSLAQFTDSLNNQSQLTNQGMKPQYKPNVLT